MAELVESFLTSVWFYRPDGVNRIVAALRSHSIPNAEYTYDRETNLFKVTCFEEDISAIQEHFRDGQGELEDDMDVEHLTHPDGALKEVDIVDNGWVRAVRRCVTLGAIVDNFNDYDCPAIFEKYPFSRAWSRINTDAPQQVTIHHFLTGDDLKIISQSSGVFLSYSLCRKIVYIGADSASKIERAVNKLDTLFHYSVKVKAPRTKHILYSEADEKYTVDARYIGDINPNLVQSTIFDPLQDQTSSLEEKYSSLWRSVSLRICLYNPSRQTMMSFFGPRARPVFEGPGQESCATFSNLAYVPKSRTRQSRTARSSEEHGAVAISKKDQVEFWMAGIVDTGSDPDHTESSQLASSRALVRDVGAECSRKELCETRKPTENKLVALKQQRPTQHQPGLISTPPGDNPDTREFKLDVVKQWSPLGDNKEETKKVSTVHVETTRHLTNIDGDFGGSVGSDLLAARSPPSPPREDVAAHCQASSTAATTTITLLSGPDTHTSSLSTSSVPVGDGSEQITFDMKPLLPLIKDREEMLSRRFHSTMRQKTSRRNAERQTIGKCDMHSRFINSLENSLARMVAVMPVRVGELHLRAELGRICLVDPLPEGLASNTKYQTANGWHPELLEQKLDVACVSSDTLVFTEILTTFGNDADHLINTKDNFGNRMWDSPEKMVVYEFVCRRTHQSMADNLTRVEEFVVEVDTTRAGIFSYRLRWLNEESNPVWVHCLHRHWDLRIVMVHIPESRLEAQFGLFARELVDSLYVPEGTVGKPRLDVDYDRMVREVDDERLYTEVIGIRVRHVARFLSYDKRSFLNLTFVRNMKLSVVNRDIGGSVARIKATEEADCPEDGRFASWYEAYVSSNQAEEYFKENKTMELGERAQWHARLSKDTSIFAAIHEPALMMIQQMDGIGVKMDNHECRRKEKRKRCKANTDESHTGGTIDVKQETARPGVVFW